MGNLKAINRELKAIYASAGVTDQLAAKMAGPAEFGAAWSRHAPRESGSLYLIEKRRLEMAARQPQAVIAWVPLSQPVWSASNLHAASKRPHRTPPSRFPPQKQAANEAVPVYTIEKAAAEWQRNRGGGGNWPKAPRISGSLALIEKRRLELAAKQPQPKTTWTPHSQRPPVWASAPRLRPRTAPRPRSAAAGLQQPPPSEFTIMTNRPLLWPALDASSLRYTELADVLALLDDRSPLTEAKRPIPDLMENQDSEGEDGEGVDRGRPSWKALTAKASMAKALTELDSTLAPVPPKQASPHGAVDDGFSGADIEALLALVGSGNRSALSAELKRLGQTAARLKLEQVANQRTDADGNVSAQSPLHTSSIDPRTALFPSHFCCP